jgi:hypothetical protein
MSSKKIKMSSELIDSNEYHSASSIHNYVLKDTLTDWLNLKYPVDEENESKFVSYIKNKGCTFEEDTVEIIKKIVEDAGEEFVYVAKNREDIKKVSNYTKTIELINDGVAVIYQGVLHGNKDFKAYGSPDLIVRSDVVKLFINEPINKDKDEFGNYKYVIIDIKYHTLKFTSNGKTLLNDGRMPAYKGQIMVYNVLLGNIQGYAPDYCYILGRGWKNPSKYTSNPNWNNKLGLIDFYEKDAFIQELITGAHTWLNKLNKFGKYWVFNDPNIEPELYPNMCVTDGHYLKKESAIVIDEITQLWNVGIKERSLAHAKNIYKISDPRLSADVLGIRKNTNKYSIVDKMIKFNNNKIGHGEFVLPKYVKDNIYMWHEPDLIEFYIDFETLSNIFVESNMVVMIGLGVCTRINDVVRWQYYNFRVPDLLGNYDFHIFKEMYEKMNELIDDVNEYIENIDNFMKLSDALVFHWGSIEKTIYEDVYTKYCEVEDWEMLNIVDLNRIFIDEQILVKGIFNFGLKNVTNGLIKHDLITFDSTDGWKDGMSNGLDVMVEMYEMYKNKDADAKQIIKYNEMDVRSLEKIVDYLRKNHTRL